MSGKSFLLIRADANPQMGMGHAMRCLAIAQRWRDRGNSVVFLTAWEMPALEERFRLEQAEIVPLEATPGSLEDAQETVRLASEREATWVVVDGYHFDSSYQKEIKRSGQRLLFVDDLGQCTHYYADIVLNQNLHASEKLYPDREPHTRFLLGTRFILLRREFSKWLAWKRAVPERARKVLLTLGGYDPSNVTREMIQALGKFERDGWEGRVVVGGSHDHSRALQSAIDDLKVPLRAERDMSQMAELMAWADVAVSAAGTTAWELAFMGLPSLTVILAENQFPVAEALGKAGVSINLGAYRDLSGETISEKLNWLMKDGERRKEMSQRGRALVDGRGLERVLEAMGGQNLKIRRVRDEDCRRIWEWSNELDVRQVSFSSSQITWEEHVQWLQSKVNDPRCFFYVGLNEEAEPVGQVRYEIEGDEVVISVSLGNSFRGKGYGSQLIRLGSKKFFEDSGFDKIHAYIKEGNETSVRAFERAGFKALELARVRGASVVHLVLERDGKRGGDG